MSAHPLLVAAQHFLDDERRRAQRGQRQRMSADDREAVQIALLGIRDCALHQAPDGSIQNDDPAHAAARGHASVGILGMGGPFEDQAVSAIVDIMHAVAREGQPQRVLDEAIEHYVEEAPR